MIQFPYHIQGAVEMRGNREAEISCRLTKYKEWTVGEESHRDMLLFDQAYLYTRLYMDCC